MFRNKHINELVDQIADLISVIIKPFVLLLKLMVMIIKLPFWLLDWSAHDGAERALVSFVCAVLAGLVYVVYVCETIDDRFYAACQADVEHCKDVSFVINVVPTLSTADAYKAEDDARVTDYKDATSKMIEFPDGCGSNKEDLYIKFNIKHIVNPGGFYIEGAEDHILAQYVRRLDNFCEGAAHIVSQLDRQYQIIYIPNNVTSDSVRGLVCEGHISKQTCYDDDLRKPFLLDISTSDETFYDFTKMSIE